MIRMNCSSLRKTGRDSACVSSSVTALRQHCAPGDIATDVLLAVFRSRPRRGYWFAVSKVLMAFVAEVVKLKYVTVSFLIII